MLETVNTLLFVKEKDVAKVKDNFKKAKKIYIYSTAGSRIHLSNIFKNAKD